MTREHYEELKAKRDSEVELTDEDRRFLKMYEAPKVPAGGPIAGTAAYDAATSERSDEDPAKAVEDGPDGVGEPVDYASLSRDELKAIADERGLEIKGKQVPQVVKLFEEYDIEHADDGKE